MKVHLSSILAGVLLLAACGGGAAPAPSSAPASSPVAPASKPVASPSIASAAAAASKPSAAASGQAAPSGNDSYEAVKAAAEKEGKVLWYDSLAQEQGDKIVKAFAADNPFIKEPKYLEVPSGQRVARVTQESRAGGPTADVDFMNAAGTVGYNNQGFLSEVDWKALGVKTSPEMTPTNYMLAATAAMYGIYYNTTKVSEAEAPKTIEDLLDPKWKGRIATWARIGEMLTNYYVIWGEDKVKDYATKFAQQKPKLYDSNFTVAQAIGAGELDVAFTTYHTTLPTTEKGAPVKWNSLDPVPVSPLYGYVLKYGQYHNAAKLLLLWLSQPKGAQVYEDVAGRGNPFVPETKMAKMVGGAKTALIPPDVAVKDADRLNKLSSDVEKIVTGK
jgi:iron(III) transport system substrate-binding protein